MYLCYVLMYLNLCQALNYDEGIWFQKEDHYFSTAFTFLVFENNEQCLLQF